MKVVGSTCALKSKVGGEDMVRCLSDQSLTISKCKIPLLDEQMTAFLQDMNSCYSKLKELVPTLPTNKKASKVEILQHVIDYIWDLQVELDEPEKSRQLSASSVPRTPLTTLNAEIASITVEVNISSHVPQNKPREQFPCHARLNELLYHGFKRLHACVKSLTLCAKAG